MSQVLQLSPESIPGLLQLARAILAATRNWTLDPPTHPAVGQPAARLGDALRAATFRSHAHARVEAVDHELPGRRPLAHC